MLVAAKVAPTLITLVVAAALRISAFGTGILAAFPVQQVELLRRLEQRSMVREVLGLVLRPAALMVLPVLGAVLPLLAVADFVESRVQARRALRVTPVERVACQAVGHEE